MILVGNGNHMLHAYLRGLQLMVAVGCTSCTTEKCRFVHVFSPYSGISDPWEKAHYNFAERSWQVSAANAKDMAAVTFLAATLSQDSKSTPAFAEHVEVRASVQDNRGVHLPTIAGLLEAGRSHSEADHVILTNWDIAVVPTFYHDLCEEVIKYSPRGDAAGGRDVFEFTRLEISGNASELAKKSTTEVLQTTRGRRHPGHDCFVFPRALDIPCFGVDLGFPIAYPPWGAVLKAALRQACHKSNATYHLRRSIGGGTGQLQDLRKPVFTIHLQDKGGFQTRWSQSYKSDPALHQFLQAQEIRLLIQGRSQHQIQRLPQASSPLIRAACMYRESEPPDSIISLPAPICRICSKLFDRRKRVKSQALADSLQYRLDHTESAADLRRNTFVVGGRYECVGTVPYCKLLPLEACSDVLQQCRLNIP